MLSLGLYTILRKRQKRVSSIFVSNCNNNQCFNSIFTIIINMQVYVIRTFARYSLKLQLQNKACNMQVVAVKCIGMQFSTANAAAAKSKYSLKINVISSLNINKVPSFSVPHCARRLLTFRYATIYLINERILKLFQTFMYKRNFIWNQINADL